MKDDRLYILHMLECIKRIELYTTQGKEAFLTDTKTQDAVIRNLQTLSESSQRMSGYLRASRTDVDWRGMGAFRNIAVHDYLGIRWELVWDIIERDLPPLKPVLADMLQLIDAAAGPRQGP